MSSRSLPYGTTGSSVVKGGTLVSGEFGVITGDLRIRGGKIAEVALEITPSEGELVIDAHGLHVFPGFIDPHVHLGNYLAFDDDVRTETRAAAAGGVTTLLTFCKVLRHRSEQVSYLEILDEVADSITEYPWLSERKCQFGVTYRKGPRRPSVC